MKILFIVFTNTVMSILDFFLYYQRSVNLKNYNWFIMTVAVPIIAFIYCSLYSLFFNKNKQLLVSLFKNKYVYLASFIETITAIIASVIYFELSILYIILLSQLSLVIRVFLNYLILKKRYSYTHFIGIIFIIVGSCTILFKNSNTNNNNNNLLVPILLTLILHFFSIIQSIIEEKVIKQFTLDEIVCYWISFYFYQIINGLIVFPIYIYIKSINNVSNFVYNALKCQFIGINIEPTDYCDFAYVWFIFYLINGVMVDIVIFILYTKKGNVFSQLLKNVIDPLIILIGLLLVKYNVINKNYDFNIEEIIGFLLSCAGLFIYSLKNEIQINKTPINEPLLIP